MPLLGEPQHREAVEEHGQWSGTPHGLTAPALWLLEAQMAFATLEGLENHLFLDVEIDDVNRLPLGVDGHFVQAGTGG